MKQFTHIDWCNSRSQFSEDSGPTECDIAHLRKRGGEGSGGEGRREEGRGELVTAISDNPGP